MKYDYFPTFKVCCWSCDKPYEKPTPLFEAPIYCDCGGVVVSPSGKVKMKEVKEDEK